jgi:carbon monoxide dehydrogenase subunit G
MDLAGEVRIAAPRDRVWAALNDPDVLARCIEGVESLSRETGEDGERFEGKMNAKVGPVRATFVGHVTLADVVAPESYRLVGEGKGGVAGFAKGEARVQLAKAGPAETLLSYQVTSSVGGKLAQLGARLIEGTAKGLAESFFARLKAEIEVAEVAPEVVEQELAMSPEAAGIPVLPPPGGLSPLLWGGGVILGVLAFLVWQWVF